MDIRVGTDYKILASERHQGRTVPQAPRRHYTAAVRHATVRYRFTRATLRSFGFSQRALWGGDSKDSQDTLPTRHAPPFSTHRSLNARASDKLNTLGPGCKVRLGWAGSGLRNSRPASHQPMYLVCASTDFRGPRVIRHRLQKNPIPLPSISEFHSIDTNHHHHNKGRSFEIHILQLTSTTTTTTKQPSPSAPT